MWFGMPTPLPSTSGRSLFDGAAPLLFALLRDVGLEQLKVIEVDAFGGGRCVLINAE
jgi:hypothetical protein